MKNITDMMVLNAFAAYVKTLGTQQQAATKLGVSASYLSDILNDRRNLPSHFASKIGYRKIWEKVKS